MPSSRPPGRFALRRNLAPFRNRNYTLFWIGFASTHTGRWIEQTGAVWLIYELTNSALMLGLLGIARAVPVIILSPFGGVVADRVDQRKLLFTTQGLGFLVSLGIGLLVLSGRVEPWHVYAAVALQGAVTAFDAAVRQALFPRLVKRAILPEAVTLAATAGRTAKLIGPSIAGLSIALWGEALPFLLNAATFLVLMGAVTAIRGIVPRTIALGSTFRRELTEGLRHILGTPVLSGLLRQELVFGCFQLNPVIIAVIGREVLHVGPEGLGVLISAPALGSLIGIAGLVSFAQPRRQGRFVALCTGAYAVALVGLAVSPAYSFALGALVVLGALDALLSVTRQSVIQMAAPARMRGRVVANIATVTRGTPALAEAQSGLLASVLGPPLAVATSAVIVGLNGILTPWTNPALWRYSRDPGPGDRTQQSASLDATVE